LVLVLVECGFVISTTFTETWAIAQYRASNKLMKYPG